MKHQGFALILVLWVLVLLGILAASFNSAVRVETQSGIWTRQSTTLEATAMAALNRSILGLALPRLEDRWQTNNSPREFRFNNIKTQIRLRNEGGKVDLNYAPPQLLLNLFKHLAGEADADPEALVDALLDWRDRDDRRSRKGAEARDYQAAGLNYVPANAPLSSVDELTLVMGFNTDLVDQLRAFVTVYARQPKVDVGTAAIEIIQALPGIDQATADRFVEQRKAARAAGQPVDVTELDAARNYIVNFPSSALVEIELEIELDSIKYREIAVVRLQSADGRYEILERRPLATQPAKTQ